MTSILIISIGRNSLVWRVMNTARHMWRTCIHPTTGENQLKLLKCSRGVGTHRTHDHRIHRYRLLRFQGYPPARSAWHCCKPLGEPHQRGILPRSYSWRRCWFPWHFDDHQGIGTQRHQLKPLNCFSITLTHFDYDTLHCI